MTIHPEQLATLPDITPDEKNGILSLLRAQKPSFQSQPDITALFAFGGTIQSAYIPDQETIAPVMMNPAFERMDELHRQFGIASPAITAAILQAKDSRHITDQDMIQLIHTLQLIDNKRILLTCGTYMLPVIAKLLARHLGTGKSDKLIGITGSMLPLSQEAQDADLNIGGTLAALHAFALFGQKGIVFAQFHGNLYINEDLDTLDLHTAPILPRFGRKAVELF